MTLLKTKYNTDKTELENRIPKTSGLVKKANYNTKITELENNTPDISNLATETALTTIENKIPSVSNLVKKTDYNTKVTEIENELNNHNHNKYIDTSGFNKLASDVFKARLAQANLITKTNFDAKLLSVNRKIIQNKSKHLLVENELNKLKTFDLSYFNGKSYFEEDDRPNYLIFQPIHRYFKTSSSDYVISWTSKGFSNESIKPTPISNNLLNPLLKYLDSKIKVKFNGNCLKQSKISYTHGKVVNISKYIVYEIFSYSSGDDYPTLENCLFRAITLTKNTDIEKYRYSGYGIGFDRKGSFSFPGGGFGKKLIIFGVDMSSSIHADNKGKDILTLGIGPTQGLGEHSLTAERTYSINFSMGAKTFCLSFHYNGANCYLFVSGTEIITFKAKDSKIVASPSC